jgi:hypothetical protein
VSTVYLLAVVMPLGGAALTVGSLWRRSRWLAVGWLAVWVSLIVLFRLGVSARDDEFMSGMVALCAIVAWATAALITGFLASSLEAGPVRKKSSEPGFGGAEKVVPR